MKQVKKCITVITVLLFSILININVVFAEFKDVSKDHKYYNAIHSLKQKGLIEDTSRFRPDDFVKRAEFYKMILIASGYDEDQDSTLDTIKMPYKDILQNAPYEKYIKKGYVLGITPYSQNLYPTRAVSRFNALRAILKLEGIPTPRMVTEDSGLRDIRPNSYFAPVVKKALDLQIIEPKNKNYFGLFQKLTRAELADILYRLYLIRNAAQNLDLIRDADYDDNSELQIGTRNPQLEVYNRVYQEIVKNYIYSSKLTEEQKRKMVYESIKTMVDSLGDEFSSFLTPEETKILQTSLDQELEGIGAHVGFDKEDGSIIIIAPLKDSPAEKAGLLPGDKIIAIDGNSTTDISLMNAVNQIRGKKGTIVRLTIMREGSDDEIVFEVIRGKINLDSVEYEIDGNIAVINIIQFSLNTDSEFRAVVKEILENSGIESIILDLRNNPGGFLNTSVRVASYFLEKDDLVTKIVYRKYSESQTSLKDGDLFDYPLIVLGNEGSASASEIVIGALIENREDVRFIGETTYGKGTVQEFIGFNEDGSSLKLTVAKWMMPNGKNVSKAGITPHIVKKDDVDTDDIDEVYEYAKELLQR